MPDLDLLVRLRDRLELLAFGGLDRLLLLALRDLDRLRLLHGGDLHGALGLDLLLLRLARLHEQTVGVVDAAKLAIVLGQIKGAGGEATRRKRERQSAVGEHFGLHALRTLVLHAL